MLVWSTTVTAPIPFGSSRNFADWAAASRRSCSARATRNERKARYAPTSATARATATTATVTRTRRRRRDTLVRPEHVADAADGPEDGRPEPAELAAEVADVEVDHVPVALESVVPDAVQDL